MKTTIVTPTYNEARNIESLVSRILTFHPEFNIIVVDDNSPDGTGKIADRLAGQDPRIQVIHRPGKAGLGRAYVAGFKQALEQGADLIFEMDADLSHDPKYIQRFMEAVPHTDVVVGSRFVDGVRVEGWPFRRLLLSKLANMYVSYLMVQPMWDFTAGFRCYHRHVLEAIDLDTIRSDGYAFQIEMTHLTFQHGFRIKEVPILFREREHGYSKISRRVVREAFWMTIRCRASLNEILRHLPYLFRDYRDFIKERTS
jgi:dolichol-phosphate mannosyltransferase